MNWAASSEDFAALEDFIRTRRSGAFVIRRGGNPIGFRSPIDPSRDQRLEELRDEGKLLSQASSGGGKLMAMTARRRW